MNDHISMEAMTLLDYFAAKAMQGELSAQCEESGHYAPDGNALAERCYTFAEAMLAERNKRNGVTTP